MSLTLEDAKSCMKKILDALAEPSTAKKVNAARDAAGDDPEKMVIEIIPMFFEIQGHVMKPFGFVPTDDGFADFSEALKAHEVDQEFNELSQKYKAFIKKCTAVGGTKRATEDEVEDERPAKCAKADPLGVSIESEGWGLVDDKRVMLFSLKNANGVEVKITNFGGAISSFLIPHKTLGPVDVVLGYDNLDAYESGKANFGTIIGRCANRIGNGRFKLNDKEYNLTINNTPHHLHGGSNGFYKQVFDATTSTVERESASLTLKYTSVDGEEGYPGTLEVAVTYTLTNKNEFKMEYTAIADQDTIVNLSNHAYWNLGGHDSGSILEHTLQVNSGEYTPVDDNLIPTGNRAPLTFSPLDFRKKQKIGSRIKLVGGYDHNYILDEAKKEDVAAELTAPSTGISMTVTTDQPGLQVYTGNFINPSNAVWKGKGGVCYNKHQAICLEPQAWPDAVNHSDKNFPSPILRSGEVYKHTTVHSFSF